MLILIDIYCLESGMFLSQDVDTAASCIHIRILIRCLPKCRLSAIFCVREQYLKTCLNSYMRCLLSDADSGYEAPRSVPVKLNDYPETEL